MGVYPSSMSGWLGSLLQESLIYRSFGWIRINGKQPFDDGIRALRHSPIEMLLYNLRAILFGCGAIYLAVLAALSLALPSPAIRRTLIVVSAFWVASVLLTLLMQKSFKRKVEMCASTTKGAEPALTFYRYLLLDSCTVLTLILVGRILDLGLEWFGFLLIGNVVVLSVYVSQGRFVGAASLLIALLLVLASPLFLEIRMTVRDPRLFYLVLASGPLVGMVAMIAFSLSSISWLRATEQKLSQRHLELLGRYESILSNFELKSVNTAAEQESEFHGLIKTLLRDLCSLGSGFWYESACLWFVEEHLDYGQVLLPGVYYNFDEAGEFKNGVAASTVGDQIGLYSAGFHAPNNKMIPGPRGNLNGPFAFVPLHKQGKLIGGLSVYGSKDAVMFLRQEHAFLRSLGSIISSAMQQYWARYRAAAQREMDSLFASKSLEQVFHEAARILKEYLMAGGCMVVFRPAGSDREMKIVAKEGFSDRIFKASYRVGLGMTGLCAERGRTIRVDDARDKDGGFDSELIEELGRAHGAKLRSWMAIPIGPATANFGVIKVINREVRSGWFTNEDQALGEDLALRLHVIIEKFLYIHQTVVAIAEAKRHGEMAIQQALLAGQAQKVAEQTASRRQQDLMVITHQLQGPLSAVIGAVTRLQESVLPEQIARRMKYVQALVEDCLAVCYGVVTTFAREAGRESAFGADRIDAPRELRRLSDRLQITQTRNDLSFSYRQEVDFPTLAMDLSVFTSVMYCLIHNAMKYADADSTIRLECGFERSAGNEPVLKVKSIGEPIDRSEREIIFEQFRRGRVVEATGRHHGGVGLGLWVARGLMWAIGGDLTVELSIEHPRLSVFVVHFPRSSVGY